MKAIVTTENKSASVVSDHPLPTLRPDYILVRPVAIALNPTDWKAISSGSGAPGVTVGCDYAGIVEEVGPAVTKAFKPGDRIAGFAHGSNAVQPQDGAFAEHIVVKGDLQIWIPDNISFEEAATLGVGITTVGQGLYQSLGLPLPDRAGAESAAVPLSAEAAGAEKTLLIYGGSTATGTLAIQFAKLSGYRVLTTCSPRNFDLVRALGADAVYDYNEAGVAEKIRAETGDQLRLVFDTVALPESVKFCDACLSSQGGEYSSLLSAKLERENVRDRFTLAYTAFGERFTFHSQEIPAVPADAEFGEMFWALSQELLAQGKVKVHPVKVGGGGLQGALEGLELMKQGKVSGEKLVYRLADTL